MIVVNGVSIEAASNVFVHTEGKTTRLFARELDETSSVALERLAIDLDQVGTPVKS